MSGDLISVYIDGREVHVPKKTSAIDAIFEAGKDVPYFCSQQYLSPVGACRMCLVEAGTPRKNPDGTWVLDDKGEKKIFYFPKPMASCTLEATDGMVIHTETEGVKKAQAGMMEFTLVNHPLDCPTCDKGGACELQDRAYEYGYGVSRFDFDRRHADKHHALSEFVILDQERCIHCKRCVRYFEEIPNQEVLDFIERGGYTFIDSVEDGLPSNFSGNITDICPVGALLDNVARFKGRNWEYDHTSTTCTACSVGCSITVDARNGRLERIVGRDNPELNEQWICDGGRFGHEWVSTDRLTTPLVRVNGALQPATWDEAIEAMRKGFSGKELGVYSKADITLEEGIALEALCQELGIANVDHAPRYAALIPASTATLGDVASAGAVLVLGADLSEEAPIVDLRIQEMLKGGVLAQQYSFGTAIADLRLQERMHRYRERLTVVSATASKLSGQAGTFVQQNPVSALNSSEVQKTLSGSQNTVIIVGSEVLVSGQSAVDAVQKLASQHSAKVLYISADSNSVGLSALKLSVGKNVAELGSLGGALVSRLENIPETSGFLVVHDTHLTQAAKRADVVLPALSNYEKKGTVVNLESRAVGLKQAAISTGEAADLITVAGAVAEALGKRAPIRGLRSASQALQQRFGLDVANLPERGVIHTFAAQTASNVSAYHAPETAMWKSYMLRSGRIENFVKGGTYA